MGPLTLGALAHNATLHFFKHAEIRMQYYALHTHIHTPAAEQALAGHPREIHLGHTAIGCEDLEDMLDSSACAVLCWDAVTRKLADGEPGRWCCEVDAAVIIPLISSIHICPRPIPVRIMPVLLNAQ